MAMLNSVDGHRITGRRPNRYRRNVQEILHDTIRAMCKPSNISNTTKQQALTAVIGKLQNTTSEE